MGGVRGAEAHDLVPLIRDMPDDLREIIALLMENPEGLWFNEIYRRLRKKIGSPTTLSKKLKELMDMGLIERVKGPRRKSIYRLTPWFFQSFHKLFLLGVLGLSPDEEASFLMELPAIFMSAKEAADSLEELLTGEIVKEEPTADGRVKIERYKYGPEEKDVEVLVTLLWLLRAIIDAIAHILVLGSWDSEKEIELMESMNTFIRTLSEHAKEVDCIKWGDIWCFLSDEWLKYYIALFNWLLPKLKGRAYPTPIVTAHPEHEGISIPQFGQIWRRILWLTRRVMHAQASSLAYKALHGTPRRSKDISERMFKADQDRET